MALVGYMPNVCGKFCAEEEQLWPITVEMNAKGGMDDDEFDEYLPNLLILLYPDMEDVKGVLKVDSGPGWVRVRRRT